MPTLTARAFRRCMRFARFELTTREEAESVARVLGELLPEREAVTLALIELLLNAIEHGNLEIGCSLKAELLRAGTFEAEIAARTARPPFCERYVTVEYRHDGAEPVVSISDEGAGFDWRTVMAHECAPNLAPNGRGLLLVRALGCARIEFNEAGNSVTVRPRW